MNTSEQQKIEEFKQQFPDIADAVQIVVSQGISTAIKPIEQKVEADSQAKFTEALTKTVPDWQTITADPNWAAFLNGPYRYSSRSKLELLQEAIARHDAESVTNMLQDFKANPSAGSPGGGTPPGPQQQTNLILRKTVKEFYSARAQGYYRGREKEAQQIDAQINQAMLEGRIV